MLMVHLCLEQQVKTEFMDQTTATLPRPARFKRTDFWLEWLVSQSVLPSLSCSQSFKDTRTLTLL